MIQESQQTHETGWRERESHEACTGCGADVVVDPVDGGLNCATCGQWQVLCPECMPNVTEYTRDAAWNCPECSGPTYH